MDAEEASVEIDFALIVAKDMYKLSPKDFFCLPCKSINIKQGKIILMFWGLIVFQMAHRKLDKQIEVI